MSVHPHVCVLEQDMGQDIESYFQEVLATLEQSLEEGNRGEGGALKSRLLQLYSEIVTGAESGTVEALSKRTSTSMMKRNHSNHNNIWLHNRLE